jgi:hypothetical protein
VVRGPLQATSGQLVSSFQSGEFVVTKSATTGYQDN